MSHHLTLALLQIPHLTLAVSATVVIGAVVAYVGRSAKLPSAVLALVEALIAFVALYMAVAIRFETPIRHLHLLEQQLGPLWPRGLAFAAVVVASLLAFGLYSGRRRGQLPDVFLRLVAALVVASAVLAAIQYTVPSLYLWRGVSALAVLLTGCAALVWRLMNRPHR